MMPTTDPQLDDDDQKDTSHSQDSNTHLSNVSASSDAQSRSSSSEGADARNESTSNQTNSSPVSEGDEQLRMPEMVNLHESGLRRSPRIAARKAMFTLLTVLFCSAAIPASIYASIDAATSRIQRLNRAANLVETNFDATINSSS